MAAHVRSTVRMNEKAACKQGARWLSGKAAFPWDTGECLRRIHIKRTLDKNILGPTRTHRANISGMRGQTSTATSVTLLCPSVENLRQLTDNYNCL